MIYLRVADRFDARALARLRAASLVELGVLPLDDGAGFLPQATREFFALLGSDRLTAWLACEDDRVIGSACAIFYERLPYPDGSRHAEVCGVYVKPDYRRRGLAGELIREVVASTRAAARKTFLRPSAAAKSLYARLGFVDTELMTLDTAAIRAKRVEPSLPAAWPAS